MFSRMPFKRLGTLLKNSGPDQEINGNIFFFSKKDTSPNYFVFNMVGGWGF